MPIEPGGEVIIGGIGGIGSGGSAGGSAQNYPIFIFTPCCGGPNISLKTNGVPLISGLVYNFDLPDGFVNNTGLIDGQCYTVVATIITDTTVYNSLLNTPDAAYFSNVSVDGGCDSEKCPDCEETPTAKTFRFKRCCDPNDIVLYNMFEYAEEPIEEGVYYYTGNYISQECYILEEVPFLPSINSYVQFSELVSQTDCNTSICKEACPDPQCYTLTNCFEDVSINVQFTPDTVVNNGEVISISLEPGSTITQELNNYFLCGNIGLRGGGSFEIEQTSPSTTLYNGRPVYEIVYTVSSVEVTNYLVWSGTQWELWKNFNFTTGPSCEDCECDEPYLKLNYATTPPTPADLPVPLTNQIDPISGTSSSFVPLECHTETGIPSGFRVLQYCSGTITTVLPDNNCWKVDTCLLDFEFTVFNTLLTQELAESISETTLTDAGLTVNDVVGNYFVAVSNLSPIPLTLDIVDFINGTEPLTYNWEITHTSGYFSDVEIVDNTAVLPDLIKTGGAIGLFGLIRLKVTVEDSLGCTKELIILSFGDATSND